MINFDDELAKFQPSLDVDQAEEAINRNDLTDVTDILKEIMKEMKKQQIVASSYLLQEVCIKVQGGYYALSKVQQ